MELLGNLTSIQNFFTSSVDQPPLQELDVDISAAEMGKKRSQLKEKETETGNKPGVLDIVEPLCMEVPAEDTETTLPPEILMMVIKTFAKQLLTFASQIFAFLPWRDLGSAMLVCRRWAQVRDSCHHPHRALEHHLHPPHSTWTSAFCMPTMHTLHTLHTIYTMHCIGWDQPLFSLPASPQGSQADHLPEHHQVILASLIISLATVHHAGWSGSRESN